MSIRSLDHSARPAGRRPESQQRLIEGIHTRRLGRAEDIARAVLCLAWEQPAWISGQVLSVDGDRMELSYLGRGNTLVYVRP